MRVSLASSMVQAVESRDFQNSWIKGLQESASFLASVLLSSTVLHWLRRPPLVLAPSPQSELQLWVLSTEPSFLRTAPGQCWPRLRSHAQPPCLAPSLGPTAAWAPTQPLVLAWAPGGSAPPICQAAGPGL